jgi:hypothetical protein
MVRKPWVEITGWFTAQLPDGSHLSDICKVWPPPDG